MSNLFKNKKLRNWGLVAVVIAVLLVAGRTFIPGNASATTTNSVGKVVSVTAAETVQASGSLEAQPFATLNWKTSGVVAKINVKPQDMVKTGDILAELQPETTSANIVSAQADLINAQKDLDDLLKSGTSLAQAAIDLQDAKDDYDKAVNYLKYLQTSERVPQTLYTAKLVATRHNGWRYTYKTQNFKGPAPEDWITDAENDLALKKGKLDDAQREYDRLLAGKASVDVLAAQAKVAAAQTTVNSLYIIAPFDGQVLSVSSHVGDSVNSGDLSVNVADMQHLYVEAQVDESDVANVKAGQPVEVTLDALTGITLKGKVMVIDPVGEVVSGLVKYKVRIDLDPVTDQNFIPLGTTANVTIHVKDATAALAVPITAIQNDANGEYVSVVQADGSFARVSVVSGEIAGDLVVVSGDLKEGDRVSIAKENGFQAPNPFGGGNK